MLLSDIWGLFEERVFPIQSTKTLFNQYKNSDPSIDLPGASDIRKHNLRNYLKSFTERPTILIIGEAPGPWGCRFSGVPFTGEAQLCTSGDLPFMGRQSSVSGPYSEISAKIFWKVLARYHPKFFVWNCIPFHPHKPREQLSIRAPKGEEVSSYSDLLSELTTLIKPKHVLAVGRKAEFALKRIGVSPIYVRHPSRGGAKEFATSMQRFFHKSLGVILPEKV